MLSGSRGDRLARAVAGQEASLESIDTETLRRRLYSGSGHSDVRRTDGLDEDAYHPTFNRKLQRPAIFVRRHHYNSSSSDARINIAKTLRPLFAALRSGASGTCETTQATSLPDEAKLHRRLLGNSWEEIFPKLQQWSEMAGTKEGWRPI
jgi:hypothetical protein